MYFILKIREFSSNTEHWLEQLKQITILTDIQNKKAIHSLSETSDDDFQKPKKQKLCTIKPKVNVINLANKKCNDHYYFYTNIIMQKLKLQVTKTLPNKITQTDKNLEKVGIEQNLDGFSSSSVETVNKVIKVKNFILIS